MKEIMVYQDPVTELQPEGKARLVKPSEIGNDGLDDGWECWQVEFLDQPGEYFDRIIRA